MAKPSASHSSANDLQVIVRNATHLGNAVLRFRKQRALSQQALGKQAGIEQMSVSSVESGVSGTRLETPLRLLAALDRW